MRLNEANNPDTVNLSDIYLDYDALQYDVKITKPEITLYFDKQGTITDVDSVEMSVQATQALPTKVYIGIEYDPVDYNTNFSLDMLNDDAYGIEDTSDGYSLTTEDIDSLITKGFDATFERSIVWPFANNSVHDQLNKTLDRIKSFEGKIIYYVTGQMVGAAERTRPIPGIELCDEFKQAQKEYLKDARKKQEVRKIRQGRTDFQMLIDAIKQYPNVEKVQVIDKKAGRDYTKEAMIIATVNKWNPKQKKRVPVRTIMILRSNDTGSHLFAYNKDQAFNGYEARSWELMNKWFKNALQIAYTKDETEVSNEWGKDMDADEEAALGIKEESFRSKKRGMNLYEANRILKKKGFGLRKLTESESIDDIFSDENNYMVTIKFSVYLNGEDHPENRVECTIQRPAKLANKIAYNGTDYDDEFSERFTRKVPIIVYSLTGKECGRAWCYDDCPEIVEE